MLIDQKVFRHERALVTIESLSAQITGYLRRWQSYPSAAEVEKRCREVVKLMRDGVAAREYLENILSKDNPVKEE